MRRTWAADNRRPSENLKTGFGCAQATLSDGLFRYGGISGKRVKQPHARPLEICGVARYQYQTVLLGRRRYPCVVFRAFVGNVQGGAYGSGVGIYRENPP